MFNRTEIKHIDRKCDGAGCENEAEYVLERDVWLGGGYHKFLCSECLQEWKTTALSEWSLF